MKRAPLPMLAVVAAAVVTGALVAACSGGSHSAAAPTTAPTAAPTTSSPGTVPSGGGSTTAPAGPRLSTTVPGVAACTAADLAVTAGSSTGGAGHIGLPILFRNQGGGPCRVSGYPGVAALDAAGKQLTQAVRTASGYLGGVGGETGGAHPVVLAAGETASALVEGTDVPVGSATSCATYVGLLVTPPGATTSVRLTVALPGCSGLQVHPVVAGSTGTTA